MARFRDRIIQVHATEVTDTCEHRAFTASSEAAFSRVASLIPENAAVILETVVPTEEVPGQMQKARRIFGDLPSGERQREVALAPVRRRWQQRSPEITPAVRESVINTIASMVCHAPTERDERKLTVSLSNSFSSTCAWRVEDAHTTAWTRIQRRITAPLRPRLRVAPEAISSVTTKRRAPRGWPRRRPAPRPLS